MTTTPDTTTSSSDAPCEQSSPCCKCAAYREIIQENAAEIANLRKQLATDRQRAEWMVDEVNKCLGDKKP